MKKCIFFISLLFFVTASYSQVLIDNGPLIDPKYKDSKYALTGAKWNKTSLTYIFIIHQIV